MDPKPQEFNDIIWLVLSSLAAVTARLMKAVERPSIKVVIAEILLGLGFCIFLAPALKEHYDLSIEVTCAITWAGSYFSGLILVGIEKIIKNWLAKLSPPTENK